MTKFSLFRFKMKSTFVISIYRNIYECPSNGPKHMSVAVNKWKYRLQYLNYIGGVTTLSRKLYQVNNTYFSFLNPGGLAVV